MTGRTSSRSLRRTPTRPGRHRSRSTSRPRLLRERGAPAGPVAEPVTWAALDCVSAWSSDLEHRPLVLASMTARIGSPPQAGTTYVVVGSTVQTEGRKTWTASALYDEAGVLVAQARHLWIAIDPSLLRQLQGG